MQIIYTVSEANKAPISIFPNMDQNIKRFENLTKTEIIKACWNSLQQDLNLYDTTHIIAASVSEETLEWMKKKSKSNIIIHKIPTMDEHTPPYGEHPYPEFSEVRNNHFIPHYTYFIDLLEDNPNDVYYFCNDDYLHLSSCMNNIKTIFQDKEFNYFFVPHDYTNNYVEQTRRADLFLTELGYMRTVPSSTPTIAARGTLWLEYKHEMLKASVFASDSWTWRAFALSKAITPMPAWSTHLQRGCLSPYIDWLSIAKHYLKE